MANIINFTTESEPATSTKAHIDIIRKHVLEYLKKSNPYLYNYAEKFSTLCPEITPDVSVYDRMCMGCELSYKELKRKDVLELYNQALLDEIESDERDAKEPRVQFTDLSEFSDDGGITTTGKIQKKKDERMDAMVNALLNGEFADSEEWGGESGGTFLAKIKKEQIEKLNALIPEFENIDAVVVTTPYPSRKRSSVSLIVEMSSRFLMLDNPVMRNAFNIADTVCCSCERGIMRFAFSVNNIWAI